MERRLNHKIDDYFSTFKNNIKDKMISLKLLDSEQGNQLLQFIFDFESLTIHKDDLSKRKRFKNIVSGSDRCFAKRANNEQCTRRKKDGCDFCGTHVKGTPHGLVLVKPIQSHHKVDVFAHDFKGIVYFIDSHNHVYNTQDIVANIDNPRIISKYVTLHNGLLSIPDFGI